MDNFTNEFTINNLVNRAMIEIEILTYNVISGGNPFFRNTYEIGKINNANPPKKAKYVFIPAYFFPIHFLESQHPES